MRNRKRHRCRLPWKFSIPTESIYDCDCGKSYRLTYLSEPVPSRWWVQVQEPETVPCACGAMQISTQYYLTYLPHGGGTHGHRKCERKQNEI